MHATTPVVGRLAELRVIRASLAAALERHGTLVLVAGEPGIGKSRLLEEAAREAALRHMTPLWGRAYDGEGTPAFWPWIKVMRSALELSLPQALDASSTMQRSLGIVHDLIGMQSTAERFRIFDAVSSVLIAIADEMPLAVLIDDLHWADTPSLLLLDYLAREIVDARLLVIASVRDVEVEPSSVATPASASNSSSASASCCSILAC
jgi:predicted ATPase